MNRIALTPSKCKLIHETMMDKDISGKELAVSTKLHPGTISRIRYGEQKSISLNVARKIEKVLDITLCDYIDINYVNKLLQKIDKLTLENRALKKLLIDKWEKE